MSPSVDTQDPEEQIPPWVSTQPGFLPGVAPHQRTNRPDIAIQDMQQLSRSVIDTAVFGNMRSERMQRSLRLLCTGRCHVLDALELAQGVPG